MGTDLAEADHPQGLLIKLIADVGLAIPAAGHRAGMGVGHMA